MMAISSPDSDFTRFAAHGGEPAFRALVTGHLPMVLTVAQRRLGEYGHLSEDVAQRVFTRLAKVAKGLPADTVVAAWLHRQTVRLSIDTLRAELRRRRRETTAAAMLHSADPSGPPPPSSIPSWQDIGPLLDEALDRLPAADRTVIILRYLQDRDFAAVGAAVGSSPEAVRKRIARGLDKLRALLRRRGAVLPSAALATLLAQHPRQAAASALAAHGPLAASISRHALSAAAGAGRGAAFSTLLLSHAAAVFTGAAAVLLAAGWIYRHREEAMARAAVPAAPVSAASPAPTETEGAAPAPRDGGPAGMDDPAPRTLPEIIAALREIAAAPDHRLNRLRMAALLRKVPPEQYLEFYITAEPRIPQPGWGQLAALSVQTWWGTDPATLTKALFESDNGKSREIRLGKLSGGILLNSLSRQSGPDGGITVTSACHDVFTSWVQLDSLAALQWLKSREDTPLMRFPTLGNRSVLTGFLETVMAHMPGYPDSIPADVRSLVPAPEEHRRIGARAWSRTPVDASVAERFSKSRTPAEARWLGYATANTSPDSLRSWIANEPADSANRFQAALGLVMSASTSQSASGRISVTLLAESERLERAEFAFRYADQSAGGQALRAITESWLDGGKDGLPELREWLITTGTPAEAGAALETGARILAQSPGHMEDAMAFAGGMDDSAARGRLQRGIFLRWRDADPQAAAEFLNTAPSEITAALRPLTDSTPP